MQPNEVVFVFAFAIVTILAFCDVFYDENKRLILHSDREVLGNITFRRTFFRRVCMWLLFSVPVLLLISIILAGPLNPEVSWFRNFLGNILLYVLYLAFAALYAYFVSCLFRGIRFLISKIPFIKKHQI